MRYDAMQEAYDLVSFHGKPALFSNLRIDPTTLPQGVERYEIRHADEDWGEPCQLARGILVNHFGTLLTTEPVQLMPDGMLDFDTNALDFLDGKTMRLTEFVKEHPPVATTIFALTVPEKDSAAMFYSESSKDAERGCIGHLRGDMGRSGTEFWTTWHPHQEKLCVEPFKSELDDVVNWLREDFGPLHDFKTMSGFCNRRENASLEDGRSYGFWLETPKHEYMLRCTPIRGDYNFYLYCYDKAARDLNRSAPEKKPSVLAQLKAKPLQPERPNKPPMKENGLDR